jgi:hypothetical protein
MTAVGYGDIYPHSTSGWIIGITIMLVGFVAPLTAFIADRFINLSVETEAKEDLILAELRATNARLDDPSDIDRPKKAWKEIEPCGQSH